jgi:hypothetical protein
MIYEILNFLKLKLNSSLPEARKNAEPFIVLSGPWTNNDSNKGASFLNTISLINIEEERYFKTQGRQITQTPAQRAQGIYTSREPDIKLNLYILISAYNKNYEDALKLISRVVNYFQVNNVFTKNKAMEDDLPDDVERVIIELFTATFEQQNQIWASLSTGYIPSVIYKVRMITIDTGKESEEQKAITERFIKIKSL